MPLAKEIHAQIHAVVESPLLAQEDLENPVAGLETIRGSLAKMEARVDSCLPPEEPHPQALLLEKNILCRLRELVHYRQSCERSLHSALNDPLKENPLAGAVETTAIPPPLPKEGVVSAEDAAIRRHLAELRTENQQRVSEDIKRRRKLFADGARGRWAEARQRIKLQVGQDLKKLDLLVGASFL